MPTVPGQSSVVSYGYLSQPLNCFDQSATPHTGGMNALLCDGSVRLLNASVADYNPYVTVDYYETTRSTESHDDGGIIIDYFPTETIRPIESVHFELLI
jgi:prepilin-type processing-associated H-X9-DG protein